jgi:hypothetical protein
VRGLFLLVRSSASPPPCEPAGRGSAPQRQQQAIDGGPGHASPSTRRSSETGQARRPLMRRGRKPSGNVSADAQPRKVCGRRVRWWAAAAVSTCVRCSRASGVKCWGWCAARRVCALCWVACIGWLPKPSSRGWVWNKLFAGQGLPSKRINQAVTRMDAGFHRAELAPVNLALFAPACCR